MVSSDLRSASLRSVQIILALTRSVPNVPHTYNTTPLELTVPYEKIGSKAALHYRRKLNNESSLFSTCTSDQLYLTLLSKDHRIGYPIGYDPKLLFPVYYKH